MARTRSLWAERGVEHLTEPAPEPRRLPLHPGSSHLQQSPSPPAVAPARRNGSLGWASRLFGEFLLVLELLLLLVLPKHSLLLTDCRVP